MKHEIIAEQVKAMRRPIPKNKIEVPDQIVNNDNEYAKIADKLLEMAREQIKKKQN